MQDVISEVYPKLLDKQQNIELQCDLPNDFAIESESELLSTIFTNLIHNANKYADNHSDILVTLGLEMSSEPTIKICVENQGEPLDKQLLTLLLNCTSPCWTSTICLTNAKPKPAPCICLCRGAR